MADNACVAFFETSTGVDLNAAANALAERGIRASRKNDELVVSSGANLIFRVSLALDEYVRQEAAELPDGVPSFEAMSNCDARFEILIDDLDAVLKEANTLIDVETALQQLTDGFLYCTWNGNLSAPN